MHCKICTRSFGANLKILGSTAGCLSHSLIVEGIMNGPPFFGSFASSCEEFHRVHSITLLPRVLSTFRVVRAAVLEVGYGNA
jgi:hypothetical protein